MRRLPRGSFRVPKDSGGLLLDSRGLLLDSRGPPPWLPPDSDGAVLPARPPLKTGPARTRARTFRRPARASDRRPFSPAFPRESASAGGDRACRNAGRDRSSRPRVRGADTARPPRKTTKEYGRERRPGIRLGFGPAPIRPGRRGCAGRGLDRRRPVPDADGRPLRRWKRGQGVRVRARARVCARKPARTQHVDDALDDAGDGDQHHRH